MPPFFESTEKYLFFGVMEIFQAVYFKHFIHKILSAKYILDLSKYKKHDVFCVEE